MEEITDNIHESEALSSVTMTLPIVNDNNQVINNQIDNQIDDNNQIDNNQIDDSNQIDDNQIDNNGQKIDEIILPNTPIP